MNSESAVERIPLPKSTTDIDESALVARAQRGDHRAYELLYRRHIGRVYALCLRMTANTTWAEELAQDAFVRAWERLGTFRGKSAFSSWLHRVAVNVTLAAMRAERRREMRVQSAGDLAQYTAVVRANTEDARLDLERAIARLPEQARCVFVLHDIEGYTHREIAEMLNVVAGTSKAQLHRARLLIQAELHA